MRFFIISPSDDFNLTLTCMSGNEVGPQREREDLRKWESEYRKLMEYTKNSDYGRLKCFHCSLSPNGDDPTFIGINRLIAKRQDALKCFDKSIEINLRDVEALSYRGFARQKIHPGVT